MNADWQTWCALLIVVITAAVFLRRTLRPKKTGCGGGCGCATKSPVPRR
jgi:hypothetical protein